MAAPQKRKRASGAGSSVMRDGAMRSAQAAVRKRSGGGAESAKTSAI